MRCRVVAAWLLVCGMCVNSLGFDASFGVVAVLVSVMVVVGDS